MKNKVIKPAEQVVNIGKGQGLVVKVTESGKTMLVATKGSKYQIGYVFGWASNVDALAKGDIIQDFQPKGREPIGDKCHEDGTPLMKYTF